jgi:hypothetical protein
MKLPTAIRVLTREVEFLGFDNVGELVEDIRRNPLAYPYATINAYITYKEEAFR